MRWRLARATIVAVDKKEINSPKLTLNFVLVILLPIVILLAVMLHHWGII